MTPEEWDIASLLLFLEDQVADLRKMLETLPREQFATVQNRRSFSRLRGAAVDLTSMYLAASALGEEVRG